MMDISSWNDEELAEELTEILEGMALQYLSDVDGNIMTHDFMEAGERCLNILLQLGKVRTRDDIYFTWTAEATHIKELINEHEADGAAK